MLGLKCFLFAQRLYALGKTVLILRSDQGVFKQTSERHYSQAQDAGKYNKCAFIIQPSDWSFSGSQIESGNIPRVFGSVIGVRGVMFRQTVANIHDTSRPPRMQSLLNTLIFEGSK